MAGKAWIRTKHYCGSRTDNTKLIRILARRMDHQNRFSKSVSEFKMKSENHSCMLVHSYSCPSDMGFFFLLKKPENHVRRWQHRFFGIPVAIHNENGVGKNAAAETGFLCVHTPLLQQKCRHLSYNASTDNW